jgi:hypothetical protein
MCLKVEHLNANTEAESRPLSDAVEQKRETTNAVYS